MNCILCNNDRGYISIRPDAVSERWADIYPTIDIIIEIRPFVVVYTVINSEWTRWKYIIEFITQSGEKMVYLTEAYPS